MVLFFSLNYHVNLSPHTNKNSYNSEKYCAPSYSLSQEWISVTPQVVASWDETVPVREGTEGARAARRPSPEPLYWSCREAAGTNSSRYERCRLNLGLQKMPASQVSSFLHIYFPFGFLVDFRSLNTYIKRKCLFSIYEGYSIPDTAWKDECLNSEKSTETKDQLHSKVYKFINFIIL